MISSINRIKDCIPYGDARKNNGVSPFDVLGLRLLQRGGAPPSFSFFSLANASSIPCDQLANSCSFTPLSRNSKRSSEIVTLSDFLLRFVTTIQNQDLHDVLNIAKFNLCTAKKKFAGALKNVKSSSISASSADPGYHRVHPHGMSLERLGSGPRGGVGFSPSVPLPGTAPEDAGGDGYLRPQTLAGTGGHSLREVTA